MVKIVLAKNIEECRKPDIYHADLVITSGEGGTLVISKNSYGPTGPVSDADLLALIKQAVQS